MNECLFFWVHVEWIGARNKQIAREPLRSSRDFLPHSLNNYLEGQKIELELSASDANVSIHSRDSRQPLIANALAGGGVFKHVRCNDSSNDICI